MKEEGEFRNVLYSLFQFVGICNLEKQQFLCLRDDALFGYEKNKYYLLTELEKKVHTDELGLFLHCFEKKTKRKDRKTEVRIKFKIKEKYQLLEMLVKPYLEEKEKYIFTLNRSYLKNANETEQDMAEFSKLAFAKMYVLLGARDLKRNYYENLYDAEKHLPIPEKCDYSLFSQTMDQNIYPLDREKYLKYIRECDKHNMTTAKFRMYDAKRELHYYKGMTCKVKTEEGQKYLLLLQNIDKEQKQIEERERKEKEENVVKDLLSELGRGFDILLHVDIKTAEYYVFRKLKSGRKSFIHKTDFFGAYYNNVKNLVHEDDQEMVLQKMQLVYLQNYFEKNLRLEFEYRRLNEKGKYDWIRLVARRADKNRKKVRDIVAGFVIVSEEHGRNLTERLKEKNLCDVMEKQNEYLNDKLKNTEFLNEVQVQCIKNTAYELENVLNSMIEWTLYAQKKVDNQEEIKKALDEILLSSNVMHTGISYLHMLNENDATKIECKNYNVCLKRMFFHIQKIIEIEAKMKKVKLTFQYQSMDDVFVEIDSFRLSHVLLNLSANEIRYAKENSEICFSAKQLPCVDQGKIKYQFLIENSSAKKELSEKMEENTFLENRNLTDSERYEYQINLAQKAIQYMNGEFSIYSNEKDGSRISIFLEAKISENLSKTFVEGMMHFPGKHILLAENDIPSKEILSYYFDEWEMQYSVAQNGNEVIEKILSELEEFDAVIVDYNLSVTGGMEIIKKIRNLTGKKSEIPLIVIEFNATKEKENYAYQCGANAYFEKPIQPAQLNSCLQKWL